MTPDPSNSLCAYDTPEFRQKIKIIRGGNEEGAHIREPGRSKQPLWETFTLTVRRPSSHPPREAFSPPDEDCPTFPHLLQSTPFRCWMNTSSGGQSSNVFQISFSISRAASGGSVDVAAGAQRGGSGGWDGQPLSADS